MPISREILAADGSQRTRGENPAQAPRVARTRRRATALGHVCKTLERMDDMLVAAVRAVGRAMLEGLAAYGHAVAGVDAGPGLYAPSRSSEDGETVVLRDDMPDFAATELDFDTYLSSTWTTEDSVAEPRDGRPSVDRPSHGIR